VVGWSYGGPIAITHPSELADSIQAFEAGQISMDRP
jgi:hypothetical protein